MKAQQGRTIQVDTTVNDNLIKDNLTRDLSTLEALYDLIDNSIDAARNSIIRTFYEKDKTGMPTDYSGYIIQIGIADHSVKITDNCSGIDKNTLQHVEIGALSWTNN